MIIIIHVDDPGDIIGVKEAIASRLEDLGGVRVVDVKLDERGNRVDEWRQETLWRSGESSCSECHRFGRWIVGDKKIVKK